VIILLYLNYPEFKYIKLYNSKVSRLLCLLTVSFQSFRSTILTTNSIQILCIVSISILIDIYIFVRLVDLSPLSYIYIVVRIVAYGKQ
jgi:hypothetical protein